MSEYITGLQHVQLIAEESTSVAFSTEEAFAYAYTMMQLKE